MGDLKCPFENIKKATTTDIAVISLGGAVVSDSIKVAGDKFDELLEKVSSLSD